MLAAASGEDFVHILGEALAEDGAAFAVQVEAVGE
jgi:hypothetical protein